MLFAKRMLRRLILGARRWAEFDVLPRHLALVRHARSEANETRSRKDEGLIQDFPRKYIRTPDREMRLEEVIGTVQPIITGEWIKENCPKFDFATAADHIRAYETAGLLNLDLEWFIECFYGERHWGEIDLQDPSARKRFYALRERDPMFATPPNGERLLSARHRARVLLERGARQHSLDNFLGVFHGELIEATICEILHLNTEEFKQYRKSKHGRMGNCQVVEFTRVDPWTGRVHPRTFAMRTSNPYLEEFGAWHRISDLEFARRSFSDKDLLERAEKYPRFLQPRKQS